MACCCPSRPHANRKSSQESCARADVSSAPHHNMPWPIPRYGGNASFREKGYDTYRAPGRNVQHPRVGRMWHNRVIGASWRHLRRLVGPKPHRRPANDDASNSPLASNRADVDHAYPGPTATSDPLTVRDPRLDSSAGNRN